MTISTHCANFQCHGKLLFHSNSKISCKNVDLLRKYIGNIRKIIPHSVGELNFKNHRMMTKCIHQSRRVGFVLYTKGKVATIHVLQDLNPRLWILETHVLPFELKTQFSGQKDSNLRRLNPKSSTLPNCAISRYQLLILEMFFNMKNFIKYLSTAPVIALLSLTFVLGFLIELNRFFPDLL